MDTQSELYKFGVRAFSVRNMIKKVAIIGGGVIGGGWAARFLLNGLDVYVYDPDPNAEQTLLEVIDNARFSLPMLYGLSYLMREKLSSVRMLLKLLLMRIGFKKVFRKD